jgi:hypothetical protein
MKKTYREYHIECDECGIQLFDLSDVILNELKIRDSEAKKFGFVVIGGCDYCEECVKFLNDGD